MVSTHYALSRELQTFYIFSFLYNLMTAIWLARSIPSWNQHGILRVFAFESPAILPVGRANTPTLAPLKTCPRLNLQVHLSKFAWQRPSPIDQSPLERGGSIREGRKETSGEREIIGAAREGWSASWRQANVRKDRARDKKNYGNCVSSSERPLNFKGHARSCVGVYC